MHRPGQAVVITIIDRHNPHSLVTVCRGRAIESSGVAAIITDGHPVWNGCRVKHGGDIQIATDWEAKEERVLHSKYGVRTHAKPVRCTRCQTANTLATEAPYVCLHCRMKDSRTSRLTPAVNTARCQ